MSNKTELQNEKISVIVPAYNAERYLEQTVRSAMSQTHSNIEILIIDDCSKDQTLAIAQRIAAQDARIRVLQNETNQGVAETRNRGIAEAQGGYIALLDSDDIWEPDKLERQLVLLQTTQADFAYCAYDFIDAEGKNLQRAYEAPKAIDFRGLLTENVIGCSTVLAKKELMQEHPFSLGVHHEDYLLWLTLLQKGYRACGETNILMHYRRLPSSRSGNKERAAKSRWAIYRRHLHLPLAKSLWYFACYTCNALKKYYF